MKPRLVKIDRPGIRADPARVLSLLGTPAEAGHTMDLAEEYIARCMELTEPCGGYILAKAEGRARDSITVNGTRFMTGTIVRNLLGEAEEYAFIIVTAGPGPENLSRKLIGEGQYLEGYLVDLIGSGIVESAADQVHRHVMEYAAGKGYGATNLYSPGYCSWNVEEQQKLFSLFGGGICGVTLGGSSLMSPIKSVSGAIGIGRKVVFRDDNCEICPREECHFRNSGH